ncbi:hypothetical protein DJ58_4332 [Yersinia frederiksenii ATCC 33641]|uniref:Uncharacterized protein n=1 Tax=Yersinia frederiksenii ATCC 33641 TaxID=349966 RepID=A0ABR4VW98_YERFR|nr:hypothetical protein DJ58_4332 [Yersinia frederiksenii ATCC 33641]
MTHVRWVRLLIPDKLVHMLSKDKSHAIHYIIEGSPLKCEVKQASIVFSECLPTNGFEKNMKQDYSN